MLAARVPELRLVTVDELAARPGVTAVDPTHVMIETAPVGLTGFQADDWLCDERHIDVELVDHRRIVPLITFAHGEDDIERLVVVLRDLVDEQGEPARSRTSRRCPRVPSCAPSRRQCRANRSSPTLSSSSRGTRPAGSAPSSTPCPPGIPAIASGAVYSEAVVECIA